MELMPYIHASMRHAHYQLQPETDTIYGEIPGFAGVTAQADTLETCREELVEALEEWIFFRISRNLPVPIVDGIELPVEDLM